MTIDISIKECYTYIYYKLKGYKMRQTIKLAVSLSLLLGVSSAFATEGFSPIAYGAKARGMGGVGIATVHGAESSFSNPALISYLDKNEVSLGLTYLSSNGTFKSSGDNSDLDIESDATYLPYMAFNYKIMDSMSMGILIANENSLNSTVEADFGDLLLTKISKSSIQIPLAYNIADFSVAISPIIETQSFSAFNASSVNSNAFGVDFGLAYNIKAINLMLALNYQSKIIHKYALNNGSDFTSVLNTPSEFGLGASWNIQGSGNTIGLDYKLVNASEIAVIGDYPWKLNDLNVIALGYQYQADSWAIRAGYRYISDLDDAGKSAFLALFLPYDTTSHFTVGGSYTFTDTLSGDLALVYASKDKSYQETDDSPAFSVENDQTSITIGLNYQF